MLRKGTVNMGTDSLSDGIVLSQARYGFQAELQIQPKTFSGLVEFLVVAPKTFSGLVFF